MSGTAAAEWRAHRLTVAAAAAGVAISSLPFYAIGAFIAPLEAEFGWSRAQVVSGQIAISVIGVLFAPVIGILVDRWGSRGIGITGSVILCAAFALLSLATPSIWRWWAQWTLLACGSLLVTSTVWTAAVSSVFRAGRGLALAVALSGAGVASTMLPASSNALIEEFGWRTAFVVLGAAVALIALPLMAFGLRDARVLALRRGVAGTATPVAPPAGRSAREAFGSHHYFKLLAATLAITLAVVPFVVHLIPLLASTGIAQGRAAALAGIVGITSIIGRVLVGWLLDRANGPIVGATCVVLPIASALLIMQFPGSIAASVVAIMLLGLSLGAELDVMSYLATRYFGMRRYGTIYGTISAVLVLGTGAGPAVVGAIFDATRSYDTFLWLVVPLCLVASLAIGTLGPYPDFDGAADAPIAR